MMPGLWWIDVFCPDCRTLIGAARTGVGVIELGDTHECGVSAC